MPKISMKDLDKYGNSGGGNFFKLANDKDTAQVRFMLEDAEDINDYIFVVHKVTTADKKFKQVNCLREYGDPVDACPLCADGNPILTRVFVPLYNIKNDKVQFWDRSKSFIQKMTSLCGRYKNLVSRTFDIERNGEANDKQTTYEIYPVDQDDTTLDDLPEIPDPLGVAVVDATEDDMEYFLEEGQFPPTGDDDDDEEPIRKRTNRRRDEDEDDEDDEEEEEEAPRRRTSEKRSSRHEDRERRTPAKKRSKADKF